MKTSLDELHKVENNLNRNKALKDRLGMRVYESLREDETVVVWRLRRNDAAAQTNILTRGPSFVRIARQGFREMKTCSGVSRSTVKVRPLSGVLPKNRSAPEAFERTFFPSPLQS